MSELSPGALRLLRRLADDEVPITPSAPTARALRMAGFADWNGEAGGRRWWLEITDAGRKALAALNPEPQP